MWRSNPTWGLPRIMGELRKLGINVATSTMEKYRPRIRKPPSPTGCLLAMQSFQRLRVFGKHRAVFGSDAGESGRRASRALRGVTTVRLPVIGPLHGRDLNQGWSLFQFKQSFTDVFMQDQVHRVEQKWQRKWNEIKKAV
jgi:hypothetical protein